MVVVDTAPLNDLLQIGAVELLPTLYREALIPEAVRAELSHPQAPDLVRAWISQPPAWLQVVAAKGPISAELLWLDPGEREAIILASELPNALLLMDDRDGVAFARHQQLKIVGTLGVLDLASERGLVQLETMFERLQQTTFRLPLRLMTKMLEQDAARRKHQRKP